MSPFYLEIAAVLFLLVLSTVQRHAHSHAFSQMLAFVLVCFVVQLISKKGQSDKVYGWCLCMEKHNGKLVVTESHVPKKMLKSLSLVTKWASFVLHKYRTTKAVLDFHGTTMNMFIIWLGRQSAPKVLHH